jgi:CheY-like chemotaxis protein
MLQKLGYEADVVSNGAQAVEAFLAVRYDLVLMDCQMPELDGYQATQALRKHEDGRRAVILALTANAMDGDRERCMTAGMDDHIAKPVGMDALGAALERWLGTPAAARASGRALPSTNGAAA